MCMHTPCNAKTQRFKSPPFNKLSKECSFSQVGNCLPVEICISMQWDATYEVGVSVFGTEVGSPSSSSDFMAKKHKISAAFSILRLPSVKPSEVFNSHTGQMMTAFGAAEMPRERPDSMLLCVRRCLEVPHGAEPFTEAQDIDTSFRNS